MLWTRPWVTNQREITEYPAKSIFRKELFHCPRSEFSPTFRSRIVCRSLVHRPSALTVLFAPLTLGIFDSSDPFAFRLVFVDILAEMRGGAAREKETYTQAERQKRRLGVIFLRCITLYEPGAGFIPTIQHGGHYREILQMHPRTRRRFWTLA